MPVEEKEAAYLPTWDETKLAKTPFRKLMDLRNAAKAQADELMMAVKEYESQMSALMLKAKVDAARIDGYTARWVGPGRPVRKLVPELVLSALGGDAKKFSRCWKESEGRAAYFAIYAPKKSAAVEDSADE